VRSGCGESQRTSPLVCLEEEVPPMGEHHLGETSSDMFYGIRAYALCCIVTTTYLTSSQRPCKNSSKLNMETRFSKMTRISYGILI
jgi:hypothetical protein